MHHTHKHTLTHTHLHTIPSRCRKGLLSQRAAIPKGRYRKNSQEAALAKGCYRKKSLIYYIQSMQLIPNPRG